MYRAYQKITIQKVVLALRSVEQLPVSSFQFKWFTIPNIYGSHGQLVVQKKLGLTDQRVDGLMPYDLMP